MGSGVTGTAITAFFTHKSAKEKQKQDNNVQLWDRTYRLIESLENQVAILKEQLVTEEDDNEKLRQTIRELEGQIRHLKWELEEAKKGK